MSERYPANSGEYVPPQEADRLDDLALRLFDDDQHIARDVISDDNGQQPVRVYDLAEGAIPADSTLRRLGVREVVVTDNPEITADGQIGPAHREIAIVRYPAEDDPRIYPTSGQYYIYDTSEGKRLLIHDARQEGEPRLRLATPSEGLELRAVLQAAHEIVG